MLQVHVAGALVAGLFLILTGAGGAVAAQSVPPPAALRGDVFRIESREIQRGFDIYVRLPEGYDPAAARLYPTVYLTDGDTLFPMLAPQHLFLTYDDGLQFVCPECGHEWPREAAPPAADEVRVVRDANGAELKDGDTVIVVKDLKIKGSSQVVKVGTKVKNIRLAEGDHDIDCRIDGIGAMGLKSGFVKKA